MPARPTTGPDRLTARRRPAAVMGALLLVVAVFWSAGAIGPSDATALVAPTPNGPLPPLGPPPPMPPDPESAPSVGLFVRADGLDTELAAAQAALDGVTADAVPADDRRRSAEDLVASRTVEADRARHRLSALAVSAYVTGGVVPEDLVLEVLTAERSSTDHEQRLVLVRTVTDALLDQHRAASDSLDRATGELGDAISHSDEAKARVDATRAERDRLSAEASTARAAAEQARVDEDLQRLAYQSFVTELRARTPVPTPHRSGVVPPAAAPAALVARLAGTMPPISLEAYWRAAALTEKARPACHIDWALLAAIGHVETGHGTHGGARPAPDGSVEPVILGPVLDGQGFERITDTDGGRYDGDPIMDRAVGPMQFIPTTWASYGADGNGDGVADPHNIYDATLAAATMLCRNGGGDLRDTGAASRAVLSYNHSSRYVAEVLGLAEHYRDVADPDRNVTPPTVDPDATIPNREPPPVDGTTSPTTSTTTTATATTIGATTSTAAPPATTPP